MYSILTLLCAVGFSSVVSRHVNYYRKDYTYVDEFDAFYKFHWNNNGSDWSSTFLTCNEEDADLFYPKTHDEWTVVKMLVDDMPSELNVSDIFVGIHDKFGVGEFVTINGYLTSTPITNLETSGKEKCVTMNIDTGVFQANECFAYAGATRPFVCKKVQDVSCPTIDKGYQYFKETRKCYKVNSKEMNWSNAMKTCLMEGGTLLVLESDFEADNILRNVQNYESKTTYYVGFKKLFNQEYYTVKGNKLSNTGFKRWYERNEHECGTISDSYSKIYLDSDACENNHRFVCEMKVSIE